MGILPYAPTSHRCIQILLPLLLQPRLSQSFVPPQADLLLHEHDEATNITVWETVHEYRNRRGLQFDYNMKLLNGEVCRFLSSKKCEELEEGFIEQAKKTRQIVHDTHFLKPLVILLQWTDHDDRTLIPASMINDLWNAQEADEELYPSGSIREYLHTNSYGNLEIEAHVVDWHTANGTESYYAAGRSGLSGEDGPALKEALHFVLNQMEEEGFAFDEYDSDGDMMIDSIVFMHSGYGAEYGGTDCETGNSWENRIWSHAVGSTGYYRWVSESTGMAVGTYAIAPAFRGRCNEEIARLGILTHEFLHTLGLPDLYDMAGRSTVGRGVGGLGAFDLMSDPRGPGNSPKYPGNLSPWSKLDLDWISPIEIAEDGTYVARSSGQHADIYIINREYHDGEYLLIENRQPTGFDELLWTGGILVYHIDATSNILGNGQRGYPGLQDWPSSLEHSPVTLLQADGHYDLEKAANNGEAADFYRFPTQRLGPGNGELVASDFGTYPNTDSYVSEVRTTGIVIDNFQETNEPGVWSFRVTFPEETPSAAPTQCDYFFEVELQTDLFGAETHWELVDSQGVQVASGGKRTSVDSGEELDRDKTYKWTKCLPSNEDFVFTIYDQGGDGLCCEYGVGWWRVALNDVQIESGNTFGGREDVSIGTREPEPPEAIPSRVFERVRQRPWQSIELGY